MRFVVLLLLVTVLGLIHGQLNFPACLNAGATNQQCSTAINEPVQPFTLKAGTAAYVYVDLQVDGMPYMTITFSMGNKEELPKGAVAPVLIWRPFVMPAVDGLASGVYTTCGTQFVVTDGNDQQKVMNPPAGRYYFVFVNTNANVDITSIQFELNVATCANNGFGSACSQTTINTTPLGTPITYNQVNLNAMNLINPTYINQIAFNDYFEEVQMQVVVTPTNTAVFNNTMLPVIYLSYGNLGLNAFSPIGQNVWTSSLHVECQNPLEYNVDIGNTQYTCTKTLFSPRHYISSGPTSGVGYWYVAAYGPVAGPPPAGISASIAVSITATEWSGTQIDLTPLLDGPGTTMDLGTSEMYYFDVTAKTDSTYSFLICPTEVGQDASNIDIGVAFNSLADVQDMTPIGGFAPVLRAPLANGDCHALSAMEDDNPHWWLTSPAKGRYYFQVFLPPLGGGAPWSLHFDQGNNLCLLPQPGDGSNTEKDDELDAMAIFISFFMFISFGIYICAIIAVAIGIALYYPNFVILYRKKFSQYETIGGSSVGHDQL